VRPDGTGHLQEHRSGKEQRAPVQDHSRKHGCTSLC
jgi:hypothetical protein